MAKPTILATMISDRTGLTAEQVQEVLDLERKLTGEKTSWTRGMDNETDPKEHYRRRSL